MKFQDVAEPRFGESLNGKFVACRFMPVYLTIVLIVIISTVNAFAYEPPIGIPNPAAYFSTFGEIDQPTPSSATKCPAWPSAATTGCYYIDKTSGSCTNTSNTYGYPNKPRCTPPEGLLAAGSYVYIHAGTYDAYDSGGEHFDWHGAGTASNPIWITGNAANRPVFNDRIFVAFAGSASYMIIENLALTTTNFPACLEIKPYGDGYKADHIIVRNCVFTGTGSSSDYEGILVGWSQGNDIFPTSKTEYVVIYNNTVSHIGDKTISDQRGIYIGYHTDYTWGLNNILFDNGSSGIGGSHYSNFTTKTTKHVYMGGNIIYNNGERCIGCKSLDTFVISGNICSGKCTREEGTGIMMSAGEAQNNNRNGLIQYNTVYNVSTGIGTGYSHGCDNCSYIGNKMYNISTAYSCNGDSIMTGYGIKLKGSNGAGEPPLGTITVIDNTCYNCEKAVLGFYGTVNPPDVLINARNTVSTEPLNLNALSNTSTSSTSTTAAGSTTTTPPNTEPTTTTTVTGTTTTTTTIPITTSRGTPMWNKKIKLFRR